MPWSIMAASSVRSGEPLNSVDSPKFGSPQLQRSTINEIHSSEQSGVPLNTSWTFWLDKSVPGTSVAEYETTLRKLYTVSTVQGFWSVYNNIPDVSKLNVRYTYHLMRNELIQHCRQHRNMMVVREDEFNCRGGNWRLKCHKFDTPVVWKELLLAAIGEQLTEYMAEDDNIGGVSVSVRERDDIVQIWNTRSDLHEESNVIDKIRELVPDVNFTAIFYKGITHQAFEGKSGSPAKR
ncbi:hypothetical protein KUTeg_020985 [Tegillarca granosa]|uniref:Eukaryotic translation initiation factor 4E type 3 n=1 Tax=Tegillarca granosa TaxID=220873 RepID=A0ABQ9E9I3_TEGGR|nr:hypothetical protein KUTeg_020985 [Tegillarca granosa]